MPFRKGDPNINRKGQPPKEWTWRGELLKALERKTADGTPMKQGMAEAMVDKALQGDVIAFNAIANRTDGMPQQTTLIKGDANEPLAIKLD